MAQSKITSLDVARRAGVSQSAVSRVFTPGASASPATAAKVKKAALELGYRPNPIARAMITGKSRIIGLLVAYLDNQFYPIALERLSAALQERGYHILVFMAKNSTDGVEEIVQELLDYQVDGIIAASVAVNGDLAARCADAGIPVVLFNRGQDGSGLSTVTSANFEGGRKVADFLVAGGHKRIAHIAGWSGSSTGRDRQRGFTEGLATHGLD
ncbi:MAG: LacI family DNA-binding transcriptional regulator, partial [Boseongicola sp.]|nr:LacI family DNA-binding transcriptional regulator [Boseongicola sp.]